MRTPLWMATVLVLGACGGASAPPVKEPAPTMLETTPPPAAHSQGEDAIKNGDFAAAKEFFAKAVASDPKNPKGHYYLAISMRDTGDKPGAIEHFQTALKLSPGLSDAAVNLSDLLIEEEKLDEAIAVLEAALKVQPKDPALFTNLGFALSRKGENVRAVEAFRKAVSFGAPPDAYLGLADVYLALGKKDDALGALKSAVEPAAELPQVLTMAAELYRRLQEPALCVQTYDKIKTQELAAEQYLNRGLCKLGAKDSKGAKADYLTAVAMDPTLAKAHYALGRLLLEVEKDTKAAMSAFETCAKLAPKSNCQAEVDKLKAPKKR